MQLPKERFNVSENAEKCRKMHYFQIVFCTLNVKIAGENSTTHLVYISINKSVSRAICPHPQINHN
jgi:hypothetical protein